MALLASPRGLQAAPRCPGVRFVSALRAPSSSSGFALRALETALAEAAKTTQLMFRACCGVPVEEKEEEGLAFDEKESPVAVVSGNGAGDVG